MAKRKDLEHLEQVLLMEWADHPETWEKYPVLELLHAIPNGGKRDGRTAAKLKNEGVKKGIPDLFLPCARAGYIGLYIEMKTETGVTSKDQDRVAALLIAEGYKVALCRSAEAAKNIIVDYLTPLDS